MSWQASHGPHHLFYEPGVYRVHVLGRLGTGWNDVLAGMAVSETESEGAGTTSELLGRLPDQAALMGVIEALYGAGFPILRVEFLGGDTGSVADSGHSGTG